MMLSGPSKRFIWRLFIRSSITYALRVLGNLSKEAAPRPKTLKEKGGDVV
jgi:hypothetical protein